MVETTCRILQFKRKKAVIIEENRFGKMAVLARIPSPVAHLVALGGKELWESCVLG